MNPALQISDAGRQRIVERECPASNGFKPVLVAYDDARPHVVLQPGDKVVGTLTIFCGHTGSDVFIGRTGTVEEGFKVLDRDLVTPTNIVNQWVTSSITQNMFDSLVSFVLNVGGGAPGIKDGFVWLKNGKHSSVLTAINEGRFADVPALMLQWTHSQGAVNPGLINRRNSEIEQAQWVKGTYVSSSNVEAALPPTFWQRAHNRLVTGGLVSAIGGLSDGWTPDTFTNAGQTLQGLSASSKLFATLGVTLIVFGVIWRFRKAHQ